MEPEFQKWTSIELLHNLIRSIRKTSRVSEMPPPTIAYRAKVKLDGTNAAVQILPDGQVFAQSRTRMLTIEKDNFGFAAWVKRKEDVFRASSQNLMNTHQERVTIFGEWCGRGIQSGVAISQLERRIFAVYAIKVGNVYYVEPLEILHAVPESDPDVFVLPWLAFSPWLATTDPEPNEPYNIDFADEESVKSQAEAISRLVDVVEKEDPWVKHVFGISGVGEGVVLYPEPFSTRHIFKAKGEKHREVAQKKPAQISPEKASSIAAFVDLVVTVPRLEKAFVEAFGESEPSMKGTGAFLKAINKDILKECEDELVASEMCWKDVAKACTTKARGWFIGKLKALLWS